MYDCSGDSDFECDCSGGFPMETPKYYLEKGNLYWKSYDDGTTVMYSEIRLVEIAILSLLILICLVAFAWVRI
jgi:hypothetical protein